jgi:serine/threonine-protein kinase
MVGRGGMGAVYRGKHRLLSREVAIKVLEANEINPQSLSRFEREVKMTARLRHPNTIDIYDYGRTDNSTFFYVMEFVDGITLQELVDEFGPQPPARVIHLLLQICGSLSEAHQLGMIHRDVKPSNILLTARAGLYDMIKVLDFGLVKEVNRDTVELTQSDGITGTPMYMSPEAVRDAATANQQSDLYSVGAVGYTLLTGLPTFQGDSSVDVCLKQLSEEPIRPCDRIGQPLPDDLQNVLMSCLRKEPQERPLSIDDLESALRQCADAGCWTAADALRWWEVEFPAPAETATHEGNHSKIGTGKESSRTTAK